MALHLIKLCVGVDSIDRLRALLAARGEKPHRHITRMSPKRVDELLDGGSLYWVIKGFVAAREKILGIDSFVDAEGHKFCALTLDGEPVEVEARPMRPFQGWRYLDAAAAPEDISPAGDEGAKMPEAMRRELHALGLI